MIETDKRDYGAVGYRDIVKIARALGVDLPLLFPVPDDRAADIVSRRKKEARP